MGRCREGQSTVPFAQATHKCGKCGARTADADELCQPGRICSAALAPPACAATMKLEIERKFLVRSAAWRSSQEGQLYRQGYLCTDPQRTVRVRIGGETAILAVKGASAGLARLEFEYAIPLEDARELLTRCCLQPPIEKVRYRIPFAGLLWEVDEFLGANSGLILAEVELERSDQEISLPAWAGLEVTDDPRYYNAYLARHPFTTWVGADAPGHKFP